MRKNSYERVFKKIREKENTYIDLWKKLCDIESPTSYKAGVDAACELICELARERGFKVEYLREEISGNPVCITMNPEATGDPIALSGHIDTVHPIGLFGQEPVKINDGIIYGPGVTDCKGGVVAAFLAMDALWELGYKERPVLLLLQTDEEVSSRFSDKRTINWMCERAKDCVAFLNTEPREGECAVVERKGILRYELTVYGKAGHASVCADKSQAISAVAEAAYKVIELEKLKDPEGLTCSVGVIRGGTALNTVPAECTMLIDVRFVNQAQLEEAENYIKKVAETSRIEGTSCKAERLSLRVAMEKSEKNYKLLERINEIFTEAGLSNLAPKAALSGSDAADISAYGIPVIDCIGVVGADIHAVEERAEISSLCDSAERMAAVILGFQRI
jgi:glutamate carboxypeptidase